MKQGSALVIVSCAKSSVILVRFLFSSHVVDFSSYLLPVHPWNDHFSTYSVLVLKVPVILVSVNFRSHQCLFYYQMSHFTTQQTSTTRAVHCSGTGRLSFLGFFSDDFFFQFSALRIVKIHILCMLLMLMLITDSEPAGQELDTQPDTASRTDVHCPLLLDL